jgi:hypothetical protein
VVLVGAGRSHAPRIAARVVLDLRIEAGLVRAALRGEIGAGRSPPGASVPRAGR